MRLTQKEVEIIKSTLQEVFESCEIYLFGSRLDATKRGGDIDLFVISQKTQRLFEKKLQALAKLKAKLHKPVDIVLHKDFSRAIEQEALKGKKL